ncbi:MAG: hypothetical protein E6J88_11000 [Deltaproteobacteria bacterium]|nr:MAG: hypothetical protein E6J88_11000 [Deltaproteobacteria bacterium]
MLLALALLLVQAEPSGFACTFETAIGGSRCIYEAESAPGDARDNSKSAADAGLRACTAAARRDESLRKDCEKAVAEASLGPRCSVAPRLADAQGRLTAQAQGCVEALRQAIARTSRAAALSLECCKCLGDSRCAVGASQCKSELADLMPGPALKSCLAKSCQDACAFLAPARETPPPPPPAADHSDKI